MEKTEEEITLPRKTRVTKPPAKELTSEERDRLYALREMKKNATIEQTRIVHDLKEDDYHRICQGLGRALLDELDSTKRALAIARPKRPEPKIEEPEDEPELPKKMRKPKKIEEEDDEPEPPKKPQKKKVVEDEDEEIPKKVKEPEVQVKKAQSLYRVPDEPKPETRPVSPPAKSSPYGRH